uniref:Baseplate wedge subunit n=1 Tax=Salmonella phage vB_SEnST11_KE22 TaxID=3161173 RepID=A0AAU8GEE0_9CAUD
MAAQYGLNDYGFAIPSLDDLIADTKQSLIRTFGENFNTQANTVVDKLTTILNEREYQLILLAAAVYSAQTLAGAEGIYLDELLGRRGIYRRGKTRGSGTIQMVVNNTVPYNMIYSASTYSIDSGNFVLTQDTPVAGNILAQQILNQDWVLGNYTFQMINQNDGSTKSMNLTLSNKVPNSPQLNAFMSSIKDFIVDNSTQLNEDRIFIDSAGGSMYIGYDANKKMIGLNSRVDFRSSPVVGQRTITLEVIAAEAGAISREANTVTNITPTPSGFISMTNMTAFNDGSDVETDTDYKVRASQSTAAGAAATRPAVISAVLNVEGVSKVRVFSNNTGETDQYGVPAYKFETVVYGGSTEEISEALYNTIALSNATYGNVFYDVTTEDDQTERIYHSKAQARELAIRVRYKGKLLSVTEQNTIKDALKAVVDPLNIADTLYNIQLVSAVGSSISPGRFTQLLVDVKNADQPDSAYTNSDVVAGMTEVFALDTDDITFQQII